MLNVQNKKLSKQIKHLSLITLIFSFFASLNGLPQPHGFKNCGNSCYMNASLQLLLTIDSLTELLKKEDLNSLPQSMQKYLKLETSSETQDFHKEVLHSFTQVVTKKDAQGKNITASQPMFQVNKQADAQEFISKFIDMVKEWNSRKLLPKMKKILFFNLEEKFSCGNPSCNHTSITGTDITHGVKGTEQTMIIVKLEGASSLDKLLEKNIFQKYTIDEYTCSHIKDTITQTFATKEVIFSDPPEYLIIMLSRFNNNGTKDSKKITFPLQLDLRPYYRKNTSLFPYNLSAIVCHAGSLSGGHYWAYAKRSDSQWYQLNDSFVSKETDMLAIANQQKEGGTPYILLYKQDNQTSFKGPLHHSPKSSPKSKPHSQTPEEQAKQAERLKNQLEKLNESLKMLKKSLEILKTQLANLQGKL